jgi:hypothetical protein
MAAGKAASFRNRLEGWNGDPNLHDAVHVWVGGSCWRHRR